MEFEYINQWDNIHFQALPNDKKSFIDALEQYIRYMNKTEAILLKELNEIHGAGNEILYKI